jgi:hypothetical protein
VPRQTRRRRRGTAVTLLVLLALAITAYIVVKQVKPILMGSGCEADAHGQSMPLDPEQASIAATIAGVAQDEALPPDAVTVAYAAALQESKLHNLDYGDRDSVGVFQQRPSEGWGPRSKLQDPVYATATFFRALKGVPGYQRLPVYKAAQAVQHSADGAAYQQYSGQATRLSLAFTGDRARAVWCWSPSQPSGRARLGAASKSLAHAFGPVGSTVADPPAVGDTLLVRAPGRDAGWAMAVWLVTHAQEYRISDVRYAGYEWQASAGSDGWTRDRGRAPAGSVRAS